MLSRGLVLAGVAAVATAASTIAPEIMNNPAGAVYEAVFAPTATENITGEVIIATWPGGDGVAVSVALNGFPGVGEVPYYLYHIHNNPVPSDGNCTLTGTHLDPYNRTEEPACNPATPNDCQVGDLSGKHGTIPANASGFSTIYQDQYISTASMGSNSSVFDRAIVIHFPNKSIITCANITLLNAGGMANLSSVMPASSTSTMMSSSATMMSSSSMTSSSMMASSTSMMNSSTSATSSPMPSVQASTGGAAEMIQLHTLSMGLVFAATVFFALF